MKSHDQFLYNPTRTEQDQFRGDWQVGYGRSAGATKIRRYGHPDHDYVLTGVVGPSKSNLVFHPIPDNVEMPLEELVTCQSLVDEVFDADECKAMTMKGGTMVPRYGEKPSKEMLNVWIDAMEDEIFELYHLEFVSLYHGEDQTIDHITEFMANVFGQEGIELMMERAENDEVEKRLLRKCL